MLLSSRHGRTRHSKQTMRLVGDAHRRDAEGHESEQRHLGGWLMAQMVVSGHPRGLHRRRSRSNGQPSPGAS